MPIKRAEPLKQVSREHHHGLLLCWKIRTGLKKQVEPARIKKYADWFYQNHLIPHFNLEEKNIFPVLGSGHDMIKKAVADHRRLKELFEDTSDVPKNLSLIESELENHIRFEERILFDEIQKQASPEQMYMIHESHHEEKFADNLSDPFWL